MKGKLSIALAALLLIALSIALFSCAMPEYTVTFVIGGDRDNVVAKVTSGEALFTPDAPDESLIFAGWYLDESLTQPYLTRLLEDDLTLYARYVEKGDKTATFVYGNGSSDTTIVYNGKLFKPQDPVREGFVFSGWKNAVTGEVFDFDEEHTDTSLVLEAVWRLALDDSILTIDQQNGTTPTTVRYKYNELVKIPATPKRDGYVFIGWYTDTALTKIFDFDKPLSDNTTIYAGWMANVGTLGNLLAEKALLSTVEVNTRYDNGFFSPTTATAYGSGVIYNASATRYYVLTNHHVIAKQDEYKNSTYVIIDAFGIEHSATLHAYDETYDLALLSFPKGEKTLSVATLGVEDPEIGDLLVSIGSPGSLNNKVTYGECLFYRSAQVSGAVVTFDVGWHSAPLDNGSSGGPVFDAELRLVGINFAASLDDDKNFVCGGFIPIEKVLEFVTTAEEKLGM